MSHLSKKKKSKKKKKKNNVTNNGLKKDGTTTPGKGFSGGLHFPSTYFLDIALKYR